MIFSPLSVDDLSSYYSSYWECLFQILLLVLLGMVREHFVFITVKVTSTNKQAGDSWIQI